MNKRAQNLADDWLKWLQTRRFYGPPAPKHIIALLSMPDTSGEPPDAPLSAEIAAFHLGVSGLPGKLGRPFVRVYCGWPTEPVKTLAFEERVCPSVYYDRAHKGAADALRSMRHVLAMVENLGLLKCREMPLQNSALHFQAINA